MCCIHEMLFSKCPLRHDEIFLLATLVALAVRGKLRRLQKMGYTRIADEFIVELRCST